MPQDEPFPVHQRLKVIEGRTLFKRDFKRWVALCAIRDDNNYSDLKLYEWEWKASEQKWKVSFANYSLRQVNIAQLLKDTTELATKHNIKLEWFDAPPRFGVEGRAAASIEDLLNYLGPKDK
jgi:hypothetical protein